jgi:cytochrome P450
MKTALQAMILLAAVAPALRVAVKRPVWSELRARPLLGAAILCVVSAGMALLLTAGPRFDLLLPATTFGTVALTMLAYIRARPNFGQHRSLPPGSLGLATSLDAITHEGFYAQAAQRWGPVFKMAQFHRPVVCVVDLPLGLGLLEGQRANLDQPKLPFGRLAPGNYIEFMNDEHHARYRGILRNALSGRVVSDCREGVETVVREQLTMIAGRDGGRGVDPAGFLERVAFVSMLRVMFGIPVNDPRIDELQRLFADLGATRAFVERRPEERVATFGRLTSIVHTLGEEINVRHARGDHPGRSVLGEIVRADPTHLSDETLIGNLVLIVHVTRSNVRGLLGWVLKEYFDHPQVALDLRKAANDPTDGPSRFEALATNFVNETLRMHQSEYFYREVVREIRIGPYRIPPGWLLRVCVRECHDNPVVFPEPRAFKPERFAGRHYDRTEYCPFSDGTHSCFGAGLAIMIARTLVMVLAIDFDGRCTNDGPVERQGNRHWSHWRPNTRFRIALSPRVGRGPSGPSAPAAGDALHQPG